MRSLRSCNKSSYRWIKAMIVEESWLMKKVDWWESQLMRKLIDKKADCWKSLLMRRSISDLVKMLESWLRKLMNS